MNPAAGAVEVFVFKDGRFLGSRCYSQSVITIGRGRGATLKLVDPSVSEQHAVINCDGSTLVVSDNGSRSGVFVNGESISNHTVSSFDEIAIGPFRLKVTLLGQEEEDPGFGAEPEGYDAEMATVVRKVEHLPEYNQQEPRGLGVEEATLPRIVRPNQPVFDQEETLAFGGPRGAVSSVAPRFSAGDMLKPRPHSYEEIPTRSEIPARKSSGGGTFEEFRHPRSAPQGREGAPLSYPAAPREGREDRRANSAASPRPPAQEPPAPAPAPARPTSESAAHAAATRRAEVIDQPIHEEPPREEEEEPPAREAVEIGDDDDDDDDIESWVEPFSLLENVVREKFKSRTETEPFITVEVIHYRGSQILDLMRADPGRSIRVDMDRFRMVSVEGSGSASLYFRPDFKGTLVTKGKARSLKTFMNERFAVKGKRDLFAVSLNEGDYAQMIRGSSGYLARFVRPPAVPKASLKAGINWGNLQIFIGSAAFHFLILVLLGFVAPEADLTVVTDAERFAKVAVKDLKLEKPKEEPKPEEPKDEPKPQPTKDSPKLTKKIKRPGPVRPTTEKQRKKIQKKQVDNVLSALENIKPRNAGPGRSDLKSLVSNIAAVRVPGGTSSGFKVAGVIGKIPGGGVRLAGGLGGGGKDTRVGSQLLSGAGAKIGKIAALAGTGTRVRGRVRKAPTRAIQATGGILDRGAIQKVVNAHMAAIQRCYEVQLLKSPGLAGKIVFDWVIATSGSVSSARQVSSSMQSPGVATCILSQIRTWRFPQPVGGSVQVRYPFVFRVQGF